MVTPNFVLLAVAMLTSPPIPPPPPESLAAAAEIRRLAPLTEEMKTGLFRGSAHQITMEAVGAKAAQTAFEVVPPAYEMIMARLAGHEPFIEKRVGWCLDQYLGYGFDLESLRDIARAVTTKGGRALLLAAIRVPAQSCYYEAVSNELIAFKPAIAWLAANDLLLRLPRYDPAKGDAGFARDLEALCGKRARNVVQIRSGKLGLVHQWVDSEVRRGNSSTYACLSNAAMATGHELLIFDT